MILEDRDVWLPDIKMLQHFVRIPIVILVQLLEQVVCLDLDLTVFPSYHAQVNRFLWQWPFIQIQDFGSAVPNSSSIFLDDFDSGSEEINIKATLFNCVFHTLQDVCLHGNDKCIDIDKEHVLDTDLWLSQLLSRGRRGHVKEYLLDLRPGYLFSIAVMFAPLDQGVLGRLLNKYMAKVIPIS